MMAHPRHALMLHAEARIRPAEPVIGAEILLHVAELSRHPDHGAERDDMQALAERAVVALEIVDIRVERVGQDERALAVGDEACRA